MRGDIAVGRGVAPSSERGDATVVTVGFVLSICVLALVLTAGVAAQEGDAEPPAFGNATKGNLTAIELTITDDTDVDETSITAGDFELSPGRVSGIAVNETGNDSRVVLRLADIVPDDNVTVSIAEDGAITDTAGNRLTTASTVVTDMDGFRPQLQNFRITRLNETRIRVTVVSSESLSELYVGVGGTGTDALSMANFTERRTGANYRIPYEANVTLPQEGAYDVLVGTMIDENGVTSRYNVEKTVLVDRTKPTASISAPASAVAGETVTFDGQSSTDEYGIARYNWSVDGNATGTGPTIEHAFETPGYHGVTLTVTDRRGNSDATTFPVLVDSPATTRTVAVDAPNATAATVTVGPNRTVGRVRISKGGGLVSTPTVRLDSLTVDVPVNESASLDVLARANVSTWFDDSDATGIAGFRVAHGRDLSTATFRFSVNRSRLDAAGLEPDDVTLYRKAGGWGSIYTTRIDATDGWITYEATSAGLSKFVVGGPTGGTSGTDDTGSGDIDASTDGSATGGDLGERTGSPSILVANSTLLTDSIDPGDRAVVRAVAHNDGTATGSYVVGLVVNNSVVATTTVTVPPGENRTVTFAEPVDVGGSVVVNATLAGTLRVGDGGSAATASGGIPIPNPLALWPGGLFGRALGAVFWFAVIVYGVLKGLALYLGY